MDPLTLLASLATLAVIHFFERSRENQQPSPVGASNNNDAQPTAPTTSQMTAPRQACFAHFGTNGPCPRGRRCRYSHDASLMMNVDCKRFLEGSCVLKDKCPMKHDNALRKNTPCWHYLNGECWRGNKCKRNHKDEELRVLMPNAPRFANPQPSNTNSAATAASSKKQTKSKQKKSDASSDGEDDEDACPICLDPLVRRFAEDTTVRRGLNSNIGGDSGNNANSKHPDRVLQLPCAHEFHAKCMESWVNQFLNCPLCRRQLTNDECNRLRI